MPLGFIIGPQGPFQFGRFRDDIRIMAGLELAEREDDTVAVSVAVVDEVLDGLDDVDAHLDRADAQGRLGTMAAAAWRVMVKSSQEAEISPRPMPT